MTKVNVILCNKCGDKIYSRARHDFRWCSCKSVAVDGGFDYLKICGDLENVTKLTVEIPQTKKELFNDWNYRFDKYGVIKDIDEKENLA